MQIVSPSRKPVRSPYTLDIARKTGQIALAVVIFLLAASASAGTVDLEDGLVAYYPFNGNADDESINGNHATVFEANLSADRNGQANSAYRFDGVNDFIAAGAKHLPTGERTVAFWFFAERVDNAPVLVGYGGGQVCGISWFMGINARPAVYNNRYYVTAHCFVNNVTHQYSQPPVGRWIHWAASTSPGGSKIYINGKRVASNALFINDTAVARAHLSFGVAPGPGGFAPYIDENIDYFQGSIDEVRVYDRALSDLEIIHLASDGELIHPGGFEAD